jgi:hypothetical protein
VEREGVMQRQGCVHAKGQRKKKIKIKGGEGKRDGVVVIMPLYDEGEERWREGEGG